MHGDAKKLQKDQTGELEGSMLNFVVRTLPRGIYFLGAMNCALAALTGSYNGTYWDHCSGSSLSLTIENDLFRVVADDAIM